VSAPMKTKTVVLLLWYFLAYGGWATGFVSTIGPFSTKEQCDTMKIKVIAMYRVKWTSDCWGAE